MKTRCSQKGFTLIELAVVIAIIAILAAVAIPRMGNATASAERAMILDMVSQLTSAYSVYTAENASTPTGFDKFVTSGALVSPFSFSVAAIGPKKAKCTVSATTISCATGFNKYTTADYTFNPTSGQITVACSGGAGIPSC